MTTRLYTKSTPILEDRKDPSWRDMTSEPSCWMDWSGDRLKLNGQPASGVVKVGYIERPTVMSADTDTPDVRIPDYYHPLLKYAAGAYLFRLAGTAQDIKRSDELMQTFLTLIAQGDAPIAAVTVDK